MTTPNRWRVESKVILRISVVGEDADLWTLEGVFDGPEAKTNADGYAQGLRGIGAIVRVRPEPGPAAPG
jgi:hypothetical protein